MEDQGSPSGAVLGRGSLSGHGAQILSAEERCMSLFLHWSLMCRAQPSNDPSRLLTLIHTLWSWSWESADCLSQTPCCSLPRRLPLQEDLTGH